MSDADQTASGVLLPPSSIAVFSNDAATRETVQSLEKDWRFARVDITVYEGDVRKATEVYQEYASPNLMIIQTDNIDDGFTDQLGTLAGHCDENTAAIVVGPVNDVQLYRQLIEMGVSDYLVRPLDGKVLSEVISKALINRIGVAGSHLITVIGAKGGVGASAIAQAAAWGVADILKQKTMFVDGSGGWSVTSVGMGFEPTTTLAEASKAADNKDEDSLARMMFEASDKLNVLATGGDVMLEDTINAEQMESLLDNLMARYPVVIGDFSNAPTRLSKTVLSRSNQIFLVTTPTLPALRLARSLLLEIKDLRGGDIKDVNLIVNMQGFSAKNEVPVKDIEEAMDFKISATIPFSAEAFMASESASQKVTQNSQGEAIVKGKILPLFSKFITTKEEIIQEAEKPSGGLLGGLFGSGKK